ncbi:MAG: hypothetical protein KAS71_02445 [Bacteroidales bacterium]|nr:hypothetical protein [Bacteroidales bacterium]
MKISRNNYESFFIDYLDGNLSDSQIREIEAFLMNHDDLREEFEGLEKILLKPDNIKYGLKENLRQPDLGDSVNESNFEFYCIAEMEGDLSEKQLEELGDYLLSNPDKKQTQILFGQTRIPSPENIIFDKKSALKRNIFVIRKTAVYRSLSIAAGIALLLALFFTVLEKDIENVLVADSETITEVADTTTTKDNKSDVLTTPLKNKAEEKVKSATENIRIKSSGISFKVGIPIASAESPKGQRKLEKTSFVEPEFRLSSSAIDTRAVTESNIFSVGYNDKIDPEKLRIMPPEKATPSSEFLTLQEFAKQKYTYIVMNNKEGKPNLWNIASAGVNKISEITGSDVSLNTAQNDMGENKKVSFNSRLLSFSTPINRE